MISIIISVLIAIVASVGVHFSFIAIGFDAIGFSVTIGIIAGFIYFLFMTKKVSKELEKINEKAQKAIQTQNFDRAINIYKTGLALKNKGLLVEGQVYSFIGILYYIKKDKENAFENLKKATSFNWVAKGMLAIMYMNNKELDMMENETFWRSMVSIYVRTTSKKKNATTSWTTTWKNKEKSSVQINQLRISNYELRIKVKRKVYNIYKRNSKGFYS